tara:strand:+ start:188 stop:526 length:339 start_codon:yes stop_codon:yes gene_type:complete
MKPADAMQFLGLPGELTEASLKQAFRAAAKKYHPDVNPAGGEMMKAVNDAYDTLKPLIGETIQPTQTTAGVDYPEEWKSASRGSTSMDKIRETYGSALFAKKTGRRIAGARA